MRTLIIAFSLCLGFGFAGCSNYPDLGPRPGGQAAPYPTLLALPQIAQLGSDANALTAAGQLAARVRALQARASQLRRRPVLKPTERRELERATRRRR